MSADGGPGNREVAYRLFAAEFEDSTVSHSESDEERAPNYVITPTGGRVNRLFLAGVLTETERVGGEQLRGRVVDPTGAFVAYAGQYQPDELAFLDRVEPPSFLAVTGKARTFSPEDSDRVYTSVRPESISEVDAETRDRWVVRTAEQTLDRVATMASALRSDLRGEDLRERLVEEGVDPGLAAGVALAIERYGTSSAYLQALRETALDAVRVVAGEREEVDRLDLAPDEGGTDDAVLAGLAGLDLGTGTPGAGIAAGEPTTEEPTTEEPAAEEPATGGSAARADTGPEAEASDPTAPVESGEGTAATGAADESTAEPAGTESAETTTEAAETTTEAVETTADSSEATAESETEPGTTTAASEPETETPAGEVGGEPETEPLEAGTGTDAAEPTPSAGETSEPVGDEELEDFEPGEFELPEEEREEIEAEFGTDFETAGEVEPAGEAGIETPEPDAGVADEDDTGGAAAEPDPSGTVESTSETAEPETTEEPSEEPSTGTASEPEPEPATGPDEEAESDDEPQAEAGAGSDVDVDEATVDVIAELDDGDGADRESVVETVAERHGVDTEAVSEAIEDAMMSGRAYEPSDGRLKTI